MQGAESDIVSAVATKGPVSIAYQVIAGFQLYKSGVYKRLVCIMEQDVLIQELVKNVNYNNLCEPEQGFKEVCKYLTQFVTRVYMLVLSLSLSLSIFSPSLSPFLPTSLSLFLALGLQFIL